MARYELGMRLFSSRKARFATQWLKKIITVSFHYIVTTVFVSVEFHYILEYSFLSLESTCTVIIRSEAERKKNLIKNFNEGVLYFTSRSFANRLKKWSILARIKVVKLILICLL